MAPVRAWPLACPVRGAWTAAFALMLALATAACTTDGAPTPMAAAARGPTVAFESVDGPPESVFHNLVRALSFEAETRQVAVVSRTDNAQYRVRAYLAAQSQGKTSTVAWVWDVYDADQRRAVRFAGEEPASTAGTGTWAIADDQVLRRIAYRGMDRLVAFLTAPGSNTGSPPPAVPPSAGPAVAAADDDSPSKTTGMSPPARAAASPVTVAAAREPAGIETLHRPPEAAGFAARDGLAYAAARD
jgi:hypothetical protein